MDNPPYTGRFAPSPTGPLHFGSLVAAVASYADALAHRGEWQVRIDDIDPTREVAGAADAIIETLEIHGFEFAAPAYQSARVSRYLSARDQLLDADQAYRCVCTRKQLLATASAGRAGLIYPGTCAGASAGAAGISVRLRCPPEPIEFVDQLQGPQRCDLAREVGDFLLWRGDDCVTYQLAAAIDDAESGCTDVVRGVDLLESTFMQIAVQRALQLNTPRYAHFPLITGPDGEKLAKQRNSPPVDNKDICNNILRALIHLKQKVPPALKNAKIDAVWRWTAENWDRGPLERLRQIPEKSMMNLSFDQ